MKILVCEPDRQPYPKDIPQTLEAEQEIVGGMMEAFCFEPNGDALIICNEEGKIFGLPPNRVVNGEMLVGTFFVVGDGENEYGERDFCSLTDEQIGKYTEQFALQPIIVLVELPDEDEPDEGESEDFAPSQS